MKHLSLIWRTWRFFFDFLAASSGSLMQFSVAVPGADKSYTECRFNWSFLFLESCATSSLSYSPYLLLLWPLLTITLKSCQDQSTRNPPPLLTRTRNIFVNIQSTLCPPVVLVVDCWIGLVVEKALGRFIKIRVTCRTWTAISTLQHKVCMTFFPRRWLCWQCPSMRSIILFNVQKSDRSGFFPPSKIAGVCCSSGRTAEVMLR